jgi:hypothetical protein
MRIAVAGTLAFLLAAGLVLLSQWSSDPSRSDRIVPEVDSRYAESPGEGTGPPAADSDHAPGTEAAGAGAVVRSLTVRVFSSDTKEPVPDARVSLVRSHSASEELAFTPRLDLETEAISGDDGVCELTLREPAGDRFVAVSARRWLPARVELPSPCPDAIEVELESGESVSGSVVDAKGRPIPGARVMLGSAVLPRRFGSRVVADSARTAWAEAWSDERGRFTCSGLPDARFRLEVIADGWLFGKATVDGAPGSGLVPAGTENLRISMAPVRMFRLRLVDAAHGVPVAASVLQIDLPASGAVRKGALYSSMPPEPVRVWPRDGSDELLTLCSRSDPPGTTTGYVRLVTSDDVPAETRVMIDARGYRHCVTTATLRLPSEILGDGDADVIELEPKERFDASSVLVRDDRRLPGLRRPEFRIATVVRSSDQFTVYRRARREGDGLWLFEALPAGDCRVTLFDGVSMSEEIEVELPAGGRVELEPAYRPPEGVTLRLWDEEGRRLFDADMVGLLPEEGTRSSTPPLPLSGFHMRDGAILDSFHPLRPGRYRLFVAKAGFDRKLAPFEVREGETTLVDLRLGSGQ